jgi:hypothetical protein
MDVALRKGTGRDAEAVAELYPRAAFAPAKYWSLEP